MPSSQRPNVLFILSDDQRPDTIAALGNPVIRTPNLDRLVHEGFAFDRVFCTTPICTPARAEILTGCTSFANHVPWFGMPINPSLTILPQVFRNAGYHTIHVGKWHNDGHPRDRGYAVTRRVFDNDNLNHYQAKGHIMRFRESRGLVEGHSTELFTDAALEELKAAPHDEPWFCFLAYHAPHDPHDTPQPFAGLYDAATMPLLDNYMPEHPLDNGDMVIRDELLADWPRTQRDMRRYRARYYAMITHMDHHIGRVLNWLDRRRLTRNTIVVFTGDQGLAIGSHGLLGKENMYDHSIGAPFIMRGPGIPAGKRSSALVHHVDHLPTLCEFAGIHRPASARHGHSLVPLMRGRVGNVRDAVFCEFYSPEQPGEPLRHSQRAVRTEEWKLVWYPLIRRYQLFDLRRDPLELVDLLVPWRVRQRRARDSGKPVWTRDRWALPEAFRQHKNRDIRTAVRNLHRLLLRQMKDHGDPLLKQDPPPPPV